MNNQNFMNYLKELRKKNFLEETLEEISLFLKAFQKSKAYQPNHQEMLNNKENDISHLLGRYNAYKEAKNKGTIHTSEARVELERVREAINDICYKLEEIPDFNYSEFGSILKKEAFNRSKPKIKNYAFVVVILIIVVYSGVYLANNRFTTFDLLLSTSVVNNPTGLSLSQEKKLEVGIEAIDENYTATARLDEQGKAFFHHVPPGIWKKKIKFSLGAQFFQLNEPNREYVLNAEKIDLELTPKTIAKLSGRVISSQQVLPGVKVWIGEDTSLYSITDEAGRFQISVDEQNRKSEVTIMAAKKGYRFNRQIPRFEEVIDAQEAEGDLLLTLEKIPVEIITPPPPTASVQSSPLQTVVFKLRYNNMIKSIPFPDNRNVGQFMSHLASDAARDIARGMPRCTLMLNGVALSNPEQQISTLNVQPGINDLISFKCNGDHIPRVLYKDYKLSGLNTSKKILVFVNGSLARVLEISNEIQFWSNAFSTTQSNEIIIDDLVNKRSTKLKNIRYAKSFDRLYIDIGTNNVITLRE